MPARVKPLLCPRLQHFGTQESSTFLSIETMTLATQRRCAGVSTAWKHVPSAAMLSLKLLDQLEPGSIQK